MQISSSTVLSVPASSPPPHTHTQQMLHLCLPYGIKATLAHFWNPHIVNVLFAHLRQISSCFKLFRALFLPNHRQVFEWNFYHSRLPSNVKLHLDVGFVLDERIIGGKPTTHTKKRLGKAFLANYWRHVPKRFIFACKYGQNATGGFERPVFTSSANIYTYIHRMYIYILCLRCLLILGASYTLYRVGTHIYGIHSINLYVFVFANV